MTELTALSLREAGELVGARKVSSAELVEATLARIDATEPAVHAYASVLRESARAEAERADREPSRGPLHGIPVGVKDNCWTAGSRTEAGSRAFAGFVPPRDAEVVRRLREAGAVIVGKTVLQELAFGAEKLPETRNPWRLDCFPGASSAGSGAAVAVGSAFGAIGSDTGGSIRIPASCVGVVGLKPTYDLVSRDGVVPLGPSLDHVGPLARTVEDCRLLLEAIADVSPAPQGGVEGVRLGLVRDYFWEGLDAGVREVVGAALAELERLGMELVEVRLPELELALVAGFAIILPEAGDEHRALLAERAADLERGTCLLLRLGALLPGSHYLIAQRFRTLLRDATAQLFERHRLDALVSPTLPSPAATLAELAGGFIGNEVLGAYVRHCIPANLTGQPAVTVPCGFSADGLPIGLQLAGRPFEDAALLRIAGAYEEAAPWHRRRPPAGVRSCIEA